MGRSSFLRKKPNQAKNKVITDFIDPESLSVPEVNHIEYKKNGGKMAAVPELPKPQRIDNPSLSDIMDAIADQKRDILASMQEILKPLKQQIDSIQKDLTQASRTADTALEASIATQDHIQALQKNEKWLTDELIILKNKVRERHIKLRGFAEDDEGTALLAVFLSNWLASVLGLEEGVAPHILNAYRIGPARKARSFKDRDIIIELADCRTKQRVLQVARGKNGLQFKSRQIQAFPDLPAEVLMQRRFLKPIAQALANDGIRYKWSPTGNLSVLINGDSFVISDLEGGATLLRKLKLEVPMEVDRHSAKRKLSLSPSPNKWSKIPVKIQR